MFGSQVDISFNMSSGVKSAELIKQYKVSEVRLRTTRCDHLSNYMIDILNW
jgi:DNA polymerase sigma